jgi:hypothetical protein
MTGQFAKLLHPMMSRTVQLVFTPASDAISVAAWLAGQQIELTSRSAGRTAAAVDCPVVPDKFALFKPPQVSWAVLADSWSVSLAVL